MIDFLLGDGAKDHTEGMQSRVHPKYKTKYRVGNLAAYDRAVVRRGDVTVWVFPEAIASWEPAAIGKRGGQLQYSDVAIETAFTLRLIFTLPLRQTEGFLQSLFQVMGIELSAPDHTTLSRRSQRLAPRFVGSPWATACISSSTARDCQSWAKVNGRPQNTADAASAAGRSSISTSTGPAVDDATTGIG